MSTNENKALICSIFDELAQGNGRALTEAMSEDCMWTFPGQWSWSRSWGPKSVVVEGLLRPLMAQFKGDFRMVADLILADDDRVVVQAHGRGTTLDGATYPQTYCFIFRIIDGRIAEVVEHCDTALVERVLKPLTPA
ncbi:nuclear transport factor 2 family protein [Nocardia sp. NEAU-G5]|uniref:Nuclear transport factor 2 family protein n=1 Tax=Nocardia albiluteola TaxID=2842303 RepID=A0ABS6B495_9NOCA|nr:nuclear transport factor 2 family protein [Nocardia albiluteola]MBU3064546.1 nuclear transport factor 2 family protein [Nocardia albiluteola]